MNRPLDVLPDAEAGLFHVISATDPQHLDWTVDLRDEKFPLGRCDCPDWRIRIGYPLKSGTVPSRLTCRHSRAVWRFIMSRLHKPH
jgi:hypothetical protein